MGHLAGKDIYRKLGGTIDGLWARVPWNDTLYEILSELYSREEAELIAKMPMAFSPFNRIQRVTGYGEARLRGLLEGLCDKGLIMDVVVRGETNYLLSPMVIGIFEFTMMRTQGALNHKKWARLFSDYLTNSEAFWASNLANGNKIGLMRALPHEGALQDEAYSEILDYEKAKAIIDAHDSFAIGICSCRHEKHHLGEKKCEVPLDSCCSMGFAADFMVRRGLARKASKEEMVACVDRSKALGLVINADNVKQNVTFFCHCCGCCCNALMGLIKFGYPNAVVTSNYIPQIDPSVCDGCGKCKKACPIDAISLRRLEAPRGKKRFEPVLDESICLGCGVCALCCEPRALRLVARAPRVITPERTFERIILMALEKGTLQNQLFDEPDRLSHKFLRAFVGGFLRLPSVKRTLISDTLRSRFLWALREVSTLKGKAGVHL